MLYIVKYQISIQEQILYIRINKYICLFSVQIYFIFNDFIIR